MYAVLFAFATLLPLYQALPRLQNGQRISKGLCPESCCCYKTGRGVIVTECSYKELTKVPLANEVPLETEVFDLRGNNISSIQVGYFDKLLNLKELYINYNNLTRLNGNLFKNLKKLVYLDMHKNNIKDIPANLFKQTTKLKVLRMMENNIETLPNGVFDSLNNLEMLRLDGNSDKLRCLCKLIKKSTKLRNSCVKKSTKWYQDRCIFETSIMPNGEKVAIYSHKGLDEVPSNISRETEVLYLDHNNIRKIDGSDGYFDNLPKLKILSLRGNKLTTIKDGTFQKLKGLQRLYLNYNDIVTIEPGSFSGLNNLLYLDLHGNKINELKNGVFDGLADLQTMSNVTLDMHNNQIVTMETDVFIKLQDFPHLHVRLEGNSYAKLKLTDAWKKHETSNRSKFTLKDLMTRADSHGTEYFSGPKCL